MLAAHGGDERLMTEAIRVQPCSSSAVHFTGDTVVFYDLQWRFRSAWPGYGWCLWLNVKVVDGMRNRNAHACGCILASSALSSWHAEKRGHASFWLWLKTALRNRGLKNRPTGFKYSLDFFFFFGICRCLHSARLRFCSIPSAGDVSGHDLKLRPSLAARPPVIRGMPLRQGVTSRPESSSRRLLIELRWGGAERQA